MGQLCPDVDTSTTAFSTWLPLNPLQSGEPRQSRPCCADVSIGVGIGVSVQPRTVVGAVVSRLRWAELALLKGGLAVPEAAYDSGPWDEAD